MGIVVFAHSWKMDPRKTQGSNTKEGKKKKKKIFSVIGGGGRSKKKHFVNPRA